MFPSSYFGVGVVQIGLVEKDTTFLLKLKIVHFNFIKFSAGHQNSNLAVHLPWFEKQNSNTFKTNVLESKIISFHRFNELAIPCVLIAESMPRLDCTTVLNKWLCVTGARMPMLLVKTWPSNYANNHQIMQTIIFILAEGWRDFLFMIAKKLTIFQKTSVQMFDLRFHWSTFGVRLYRKHHNGR